MQEWDHNSRYVSILANRVRRRIDAMSFRGQYSGTEGKALHFLLANTDRDLFQKDFEEEFGLRPPSASALIRKMENDGLITRTTVAYDGRLKKIVPSEKALQNRQNVMQGLQNIEDRLNAGISEEDLAVWLRVMKQMIKNL